MTSLVDKYAPTLRDEWLSLQPFQDVIVSCSAGPQPQSERDSMDEPQHIHLDFSTWEGGEIIILCFWVIQKDRVFCKTWDGDRPSSMEQLWNYLRQLPRPARSFYQ
jgi:hypothetical protein